MAALDERDRRLAQEIAAGVLRRRRELDRRLRGLLARRWARTDGTLRDLLRIGAYQLTHLDRVPAYAAVQSTVELAKQRTGPKSASFVNAVLRGLLRAGEATEGTTLGARYSHPDWLVVRWVARFGPEATQRLLHHNNRRPSLVIQPLRWSGDRLREALAGEGLVVSDAAGGDGLIVQARRPQELPGFADGAFIVQGPAQARFLRAAGLAAGQLVWDCCAAPGGKAVTLSREHRVLASDRDRGRLRRLVETVGRTRATSALMVAEAERPPLAPGTVDAVWLDAPCSATATFARHPDARWRLSPRRLLALARRQRELLAKVAPLVRPGGHLVYTTCSLEAEENAECIEQFLATHSTFRRAQPDLEIFPPDTGCDGGYLALLRRM